MGIGEDQHVLGAEASGLLGQLRPALADVDAALLQAPQQGDRIGNVQVFLGAVAAHVAVIVAQHRLCFALVEQEKAAVPVDVIRSEEHTSELQSLMRTSYAFFCLNKNTNYTLT